MEDGKRQLVRVVEDGKTEAPAEMGIRLRRRSVVETGGGRQHRVTHAQRAEGRRRRTEREENR